MSAKISVFKKFPIIIFISENFLNKSEQECRLQGVAERTLTLELEGFLLVALLWSSVPL